MIRFAAMLFIGAFLSLFFFPWPIAAVLGAIAAPFLPVVPLALGLAADTLYLAPNASLHTLPIATMIGLAGTIFATLVRRHLETRIMVP